MKNEKRERLAYEMTWTQTGNLGGGYLGNSESLLRLVVGVMNRQKALRFQLPLHCRNIFVLARLARTNMSQPLLLLPL